MAKDYGSIYNGARGTSNIFEKRLKIEMDDTIAELQPDANPLLFLIFFQKCC